MPEGFMDLLTSKYWPDRIVSKNHSFWNECVNFTIFNIRKIHCMNTPYEANFTVLLYVKYTLYFQVFFLPECVGGFFKCDQQAPFNV